MLLLYHFNQSTMSKRNKKSKRAHALVGGSSSTSVSASLSCSESAPIEHLVESHVVPFPHYPRRPFSISLKKEELFQNIFIIEQVRVRLGVHIYIDCVIYKSVRVVL